jgi:AI-2 transport protein TqsA
VVAAVPGILIALLQLGPGPALAYASAYLVITILIGSILDPILTGQQLRLSPIVVLVSLVFWGWTWGPIGAFLSVPLTITMRMVMERVEALRPYAALLGPVDVAPSMRRG